MVDGYHIIEWNPVGFSISFSFLLYSIMSLPEEDMIGKVTANNH